MNYTHMTLLAFIAKKLKATVKYVETRSENIASGTHNNERVFYVKVAANKEGVVKAIDVKAIDNCGAYPRYEPAGAVIWSQVTPGIYGVKNVRVRFVQVTTNKGPTGPVRGYSRLQHNFMWERVMDMLARRLGLDPAEVRLRNFIRKEEMPYKGPSYAIYDGGDYVGAFRKLLDALDYAKWRKEQEEARKTGRYIGIGFSSVIDSGANNFGQVKIINRDFPVSGNSEAAMVMVDQVGNIVARIGATDTGQSHATTMAQIVAEVFDVDPSEVQVEMGFDTLSGVWAQHSGAYASRSAVLAGSAIYMAAVRLRDKMIKIASHLLNESPSNLEVRGKRIVSKSSGKEVSFDRIATVAWSDVMFLPEGMEPGLVSHYVYRPDFIYNLPDEKNRINNTLTYSYTMHGTVVEVDPETMTVKILKHVVVSDPGVMINPLVVEGQELGATMHGISAALYEDLVYDAEGVLLSSTFYDYMPIGAKEMPTVELLHSVTRSTSSMLGVRGIGEGGGGPIGSIVNAVEDALTPLGLRLRRSHINSAELYGMLSSHPGGS
ncbi:xanthine dehydrogenase family protein molybdopterin-binding subunit [Sulfodiicoccus acidiphilus]|uniref:xanthine dehydrogenase family protein molybdopterin-binding subunit n=1 Tax=Sulfodiicoccus acidiphilus TaxID=1670455 RepID=UPI0030B848A7